MGVYVFRSAHADVIKVGHYVGDNAWGRVARRGFGSCVCPSAVKGRVAAGDLRLVAWFPCLGRRDEGRAHRALRQWAVCGEWFSGGAEAAAVQLLRELPGGDREASGACSLDAALAEPRRRRARGPRGQRSEPGVPDA